MANHLQDAMARMLDEYDERRRKDLEREKREKDDESQFLERFLQLRREVIRPVFDAAGALLEARGHRYSITEQEFTSGEGGRITEAGITLRITTAGTRAPLHEDQRALSIQTRHYNKTVWINSGEAPNAGGIAGAKGAYALEKVDRQLIESELLAFVAKVMVA